MAALLGNLAVTPLQDDDFAEVRSVVEGAKALTRPQKRAIDDPGQQRVASTLAALEAEIANFDQRQRRAALVSVPGPQRIRGLAGSGKTVILAMKAAHLHLTRPDDAILVTFYTRSLRSSIKNMITRFYRHYRDEDPDWKKLHIRHAWGGSNSSGVYADTCRAHGYKPLSLRDAQQGAGKLDPFDFVCRDLISRVNVSPRYDHILIDEGQDFPGGFYELCFYLARGHRDEKSLVWAYDELQNILNVTIRSPEQLFGQDVDRQPRISLDRTAGKVPPGSTNDTVLSKCYRNQREVLLTAHALGFGIYGEGIVQLLESPEHWQDVGYEVVEGRDFQVGTNVRIMRPAENNPVSLTNIVGTPVVDWFAARTLSAEIEWIAQQVHLFLAGGLQPEDILVVALDDRNARTYLSSVSEALALSGVASNNIIADPYSEPPFAIPGRVTLSTVYRAKGNEAAVVFAVGVDAVVTKTRSGRNKLFTAFTRTKAWLRVSGMGDGANAIGNEIQSALEAFPELRFTMPDLKRVELIQRDLSERQIRAKRIRDEFMTKLKSEGYSEDEIAELLSLEFKNG